MGKQLLAIAGAQLLIPTPFMDERGSFVRMFDPEVLHKVGIDLQPVQISYSSTTHIHTLRGMHFQTRPFGEQKLIQVLHGTIQDCIVDLRQDSPSFGQHIMLELSAAQPTWLYIPEGVAHGFLSLTDQVLVTYCISAAYHAELNSGFCWNDPKLALPWAHTPSLVSAKDKQLPNFETSVALWNSYAA